MRIAGEAARAIRAATQAAIPLEACGLLLGSASHITRATLARNVAAEPDRRFEIDPAHLLGMQRAAREAGLAILGCWHSHPNGRPAPSRHDAAGAATVGWLWLIAVPGGGLTLWRWSGSGFLRVACHETSA